MDAESVHVIENDTNVGYPILPDCLRRRSPSQPIAAQSSCEQDLIARDRYPCGCLSPGQHSPMLAREIIALSALHTLALQLPGCQRGRTLPVTGQYHHASSVLAARGNDSFPVCSKSIGQSLHGRAIRGEVRSTSCPMCARQH